MALPLLWIDRIFDKLTLTYGQAFLRRWQDIDLNSVKSDWSHELDGFESHPGAIAFALQNLPTDRPPTVLEFRATARRAPADDAPRLPQPKANPEVVRAELEKIELSVREAAAAIGGDGWARRILQRHEAGLQNYTPYVLQIARDTLCRNHAQGDAS